MNFEHTQPAQLDASGASDPWTEFRVNLAAERLRLLRELRDTAAPVILSAPDGSNLSATLWAVDAGANRVNFSADPASTQLPRLVEANEIVAVAYLSSVKLQFDLHDPVLVRGHNSCALQCPMPHAIYRFQRRSAFRVRTPERLSPVARMRHPAVPEIQLALRVLDLSIGGCALWMPQDLPPLQAGTVFGTVVVELDADTRFEAELTLQHVSAGGGSDRSAAGLRLGCEWQRLGGSAGRALQRWIDRTQQRRRLLTLD
ncbi:MAG: flagellar regulator YcgR PilZN domain-containing protein [Rubrivivax sp.]